MHSGMDLPEISPKKGDTPGADGVGRESAGLALFLAISWTSVSQGKSL